MNYCGYYTSPIGILKIEVIDQHIVGLAFAVKIYQSFENEVVLQCKKELDEYFNGTRESFDVSTKIVSGTDFEISVWEELKKIPYGKSLSYQDVAKRIGNPNAARAIGNSNRKNPIIIICPCHRIIQKNGKIGGYIGGNAAKQYLLELEHKSLLKKISPNKAILK